MRTTWEWYIFNFVLECCCSMSMFDTAHLYHFVWSWSLKLKLEKANGPQSMTWCQDVRSTGSRLDLIWDVKLKNQTFLKGSLQMQTLGERATVSLVPFSITFHTDERLIWKQTDIREWSTSDALPHRFIHLKHCLDDTWYHGIKVLHFRLPLLIKRKRNKFSLLLKTV